MMAFLLLSMYESKAPAILYGRCVWGGWFWGQWTGDLHCKLSAEMYCWEESPKCQYLWLFFSWADSFSSEKSSISLLSRVVGEHMSDHLSSRSQAGERAGDGHSVSPMWPRETHALPTGGRRGDPRLHEWERGMTVYFTGILITSNPTFWSSSWSSFLSLSSVAWMN